MVAAEKKFLFVGNEPALDLLNTTPVLAHGPVDLLETFGDLTRWLAAAGLLAAPKADALRRRWDGTREGHAALAQAKKLREALRDLLVARIHKSRIPVKAMETINDALATAAATVSLEWNGEGHTFTRTVHHSTDGQAAETVARLAEAAAALLAGKDLSLVRKCENPACVLHFYDTSKNHLRRWCSMDICGNRMKVAAHYRRQKEASP